LGRGKEKTERGKRESIRPKAVAREEKAVGRDQSFINNGDESRKRDPDSGKKRRNLQKNMPEENTLRGQKG